MKFASHICLLFQFILRIIEPDVIQHFMQKTFTRIVFGIMLLLAVQVHAQQDPQYSQFMFNKLAYNPAYAGSSDKICVTMLGRNQWYNFGGGQIDLGQNKVYRGDAPSTMVFNIHSNLGKRFGIGANISKDMIGFDNYVTFGGDLSYRQPIGDGTLAFGVYGGMLQAGVDGTKYKPIDQGDPNIPTEKVTGSSFDMNAGIYYTLPQLSIFNNFYAGASITHLNAPDVTVTYGQSSGSRTYHFVRHYYLHAGADYDLNSSLTLNPNVILKTDMAKTSVDVNCMAVWNQNIRGGIGYRAWNSIILLAGYDFPIKQNTLNVGFSYDVTAGRIFSYNTGSYELTLRYCFGVHYTPPPKIIVPRLTPRFL